MGRPIRLVIFDCDGILVDSERVAVRVDVVVLAELGWAMTEADVVERFMGRTDADMASQIEAHLGRPLPANWEEPFQPLYRAAFETELKPVPGIVTALDEIATVTCVASSGSHERIRYTLGLTGLYHRFAGRIFSATEVAEGKPAPDLFLHAAKRMGVPAADCVVVEDSRYGIEAARAAGMRAFGYAGGLTPRSWLEGPGTVVFDDMRDLPRLLGSRYSDRS
ncbi:MAG: HAD family hydrolase [Candidatus Rokubacteria bacterium]|nr:HAD family hydrolase [Candidatus Rokubacteria bacterium]